MSAPISSSDSQTKVEQDVEVSDSSDAELEAALQVEDEGDEGEVPPAGIPQQQQQPRLVNQNNGISASGSSKPTNSPFKLPPNPTIPQDLSLIMEMVTRNEVVGSLPPISMSAAEKRKLVEESLKGKGKGKEVEIEAGEIHEENPKSHIEEADSSSDSDSSSEFVTSSEEESDDENEKKRKEPMNEKEHAQLKKELDDFVRSSNEVEMDSDDEISSDEDEDGDISFPGLDKMGIEFMDEDEDEGGPSNSGPIISIHEAPLPTVAQPPLMKLPQGEGVSLAGDVVSWMREKKVELWLEKEKRRLEEEEKEVDKMAEEHSSDSANVQRVSDAKNVNTGAEVENVQIEDSNSTGKEASSTTTEETNKGEIKDEINKNDNQVKEELETPAIITKPKAQEPKFTSSGTVVVRAMQSRPGAADEGWLEEGSVLCWEDGRVLGTVHETFGPLTSPFYTIRLPPPPFPYPSPDSLVNGTKLYYPLNPSFRSFVNMLAVRDPRFKGSDASNIYDEEIGEDEMEWSDDELEAEAKKRRKQRKGSKAPNNNNNANKGKQNNNKGGPSRMNIPGLPNRPHFDYHPDQDNDAPETASLYGGDNLDNNEDWEKMSDAGMSTISSRSRHLPEPYDLDDPNSQPSQPGSGATPGQGQRGGGGGARGRGQGRDRDRGTGRGRGGRGRGRGGNNNNNRNSGQHGRSDSASSSQNNGNNGAPRQQFSLPVNPMMNQQMHQQQNFNQSYNPQQQQQQYYPQQNQNNFSYPPQQQQQQNFPQFQYPPQQTYSQMQFPQQSYNNNDTYEPNQPSTGMPSYQPQPQIQSSYPPFMQQQGYNQSGFMPQHQHQQQQTQSPGVPAINPRFAAQYSQMMNNQSQQQQGQGYEYGYGGSHYSE